MNAELGCGHREARALLARPDLVPLTTDIVDEAANVGEPLLRGPDAVQLASALSIRADLTAFSRSTAAVPAESPRPLASR